MRRLTLISTVVLTIVSSSCEKRIEPAVQLEQQEPTVPEQIDGIISEVVNALDRTSAHYSHSINISIPFSTEVISLQSLISLANPSVADFSLFENILNSGHLFDNDDQLKTRIQMIFDQESDGPNRILMNQRFTHSDNQEFLKVDIVFNPSDVSFRIEITLLGQLRFEIEAPALLTFLSGYFELVSILDEEESYSSQRISEINELIDELNEACSIKFYFNDEYQGTCGFELLEDNSDYNIEIVLKYDKSGQSYAIHGLADIFNEAFEAVSSISNLLQMIAKPEAAGK